MPQMGLVTRIDIQQAAGLIYEPASLINEIFIIFKLPLINYE